MGKLECWWKASLLEVHGPTAGVSQQVLERFTAPFTVKQGRRSGICQLYEMVIEVSSNEEGNDLAKVCLRVVSYRKLRFRPAPRVGMGAPPPRPAGAAHTSHSI